MLLRTNGFIPRFVTYLLKPVKIDIRTSKVVPQHDIDDLARDLAILHGFHFDWDMHKGQPRAVHVAERETSAFELFCRLD